MRIGFLGGTFDPIHVGHLILASELCEAGKLDQVLFVPAGHPPHKRSEVRASGIDRLRMVRLAVEGEARFSVSGREVDREGLSFTRDTLRELRRERSADDWVLLMGLDTLADLPSWMGVEEILREFELLVGIRRGVEAQEAMSRLEGLFGEKEVGHFRISICSTPIIEIAAREIRKRLTTGRSIRYLVPGNVEEYIRERGLYLREQEVPEFGTSSS